MYRRARIRTAVMMVGRLAVCALAFLLTDATSTARLCVQEAQGCG
jgi:hypothetical protein